MIKKRKRFDLIREDILKIKNFSCFNIEDVIEEISFLINNDNKYVLTEDESNFYIMLNNEDFASKRELIEEKINKYLGNVRFILVNDEYKIRITLPKKGE